MSEKRSRKPLIVPIFIPNEGCPDRCIYCHQEKITAQATRILDPVTVRGILESAVGSAKFDRGRRREVAFYGGTFTRLPLVRMAELLDAVAPYLKEGTFDSIRVSTRPDAIDEERLDLLRQFGVDTVELGAQSMDDEVLALSRRGYAARHILSSARLLREYGFKVGIQLMPGLPGDSEEKFMETVEEVTRLRPDMVRLYPTVVIRGTELARWYMEGRYRPLGLEEAVRICRESCIRLEGKGIPVIRIGLMSSPSLLEQGQIMAGPWHEAFGFLVRSDIFHKGVEPYLPKPGQANKIRIRVSPREIPLVRGYKNAGLRAIELKTGARVEGVFPDDGLAYGKIEVEGV